MYVKVVGNPKLQSIFGWNVGVSCSILILIGGGATLVQMTFFRTTLVRKKFVQIDVS